MATSEYNPDCGYAWMVVAACFAINFIMTGLARAAGVLYMALIDVYGVSREVATTPFSVRFCVRNMSGPLVGALGQRFGIRPVVFLGGLIAGLGGILSALAPDVTWITAAWGGIHGLGYGMCNLIHVIMINRYFSKYKGFALGVCLSGDCVGTFLLPLVLEFLMSIYDLRGTFLILAGISLNVVPAAMLLKSPAWEKGVVNPKSESQIESEPEKYSNSICKKGNINEGFDSMPENCDIKRELNKDSLLPMVTINEPAMGDASIQNHQISNFKVEDVSIEDEEMRKKHQYRQYIEFWFSDRNRNIFINEALKNDIYSLRQSESLRIVNENLKKKRFSWNFSTFSTKRRKMSGLSVLSCPCHMGKSILDSKSIHSRTNSINVHKPYTSNTSSEPSKNVPNQLFIAQNPCFQHETDKVINIVSESLGHRKSSICVNQFQPSLNLSMINKPSQEEQFTEVKLYEIGTGAINKETREGEVALIPEGNALKKFIKTNLKPMFLVISATMALACLFFISVFTIIIDYASDSGVGYGKYLIIAFSVTDCFGRIVLGVVLDKKWISLSHFAGLTVGLMGLFVAIMPFYKCFTFWMVSFSLCGFVLGGSAIMWPLLVERYMDRDEESVALGCLNFYGGLLMFPIPPMIGYFRDNIGSYDGVFWTVGVLCIFSASLWIFEPCLATKQSKSIEKIDYSDEVANNERNA